MKTKAVIDLAPLAAGLSSTLVAAGMFVIGPASTMLNTAGLVVGSMTLGALLSHMPRRETTSANANEQPSN